MSLPDPYRKPDRYPACAKGVYFRLKRFTIVTASSSSCSHVYVNHLTHEGESACYLAAQRGHLEVVRLLLKAHADINQLTNDLSCPLYEAVSHGHTDVVELLVSKGAEVNRIHTESSWTCLHQAAYKGHTEIVRILVNKCNLEAVDDHRISLLFVAAAYGQRGCLEILVNAGANVNTQAVDLSTPLFIASQEGHQACVDFLLDHGADPNMVCSHDWPQFAIHAAAQFGQIGILRSLIAGTDRACDRGESMVSPLDPPPNSLQNMDSADQDPIQRALASQEPLLVRHEAMLSHLLGQIASLTQAVARLTLLEGTPSVAHPALQGAEAPAVEPAAAEVTAPSLGSGAEEAAHRLLNLKQGKRSMADYSIDFQILAEETGWDGRLRARWSSQCYNLHEPSGQPRGAQAELREQREELDQEEPMQLGHSRVNSTERHRRLVSAFEPPDLSSVPPVYHDLAEFDIKISFSESVKLLIAAGARLNEEDWIYALATDEADLLQLIFEHRWIPRPEAVTSDECVLQHDGKTELKLRELNEMLCVALNQVHFAGCWLPLLLKAGLEPSLLLQPHMLEEADSQVLNYLLQFVNWSTLFPHLKHILDRRVAEKSWDPHPCFGRNREDLMRTNVVQQFPVPNRLHDFLKFRDIPEASYTHVPPLPISQRIWGMLLLEKL
ncbi:ankyrin repeat and SOCS box protein 3-like [Pelmatolapia mariae]|uniref:ankyrin repeat and SOCS box protein 3-like n=1 Tax=Pelmatolapia mariae TaxID=158779 RepID=UPI003211F360